MGADMTKLAGAFRNSANRIQNNTVLCVFV